MKTTSQEILGAAPTVAIEVAKEAGALLLAERRREASAAAHVTTMRSMPLNLLQRVDTCRRRKRVQRRLRRTTGS